MYPLLEKSKRSARQRTPGGRRVDSEGLRLGNRSGWGLGRERGPRRSFGIPAGYGTGRISRIRILASALGPALNRQAGFTAARPAANGGGYSGRRY